jgi:acetyltransferase-like isoleucine patch superfamily enzyme
LPAAIYGFNHGIERVDIPIKDQPVASRGITIGEDVWIERTRLSRMASASAPIV